MHRTYIIHLIHRQRIYNCIDLFVREVEFYMHFFYNIQFGKKLSQRLGYTGRHGATNMVGFRCNLNEYFSLFFKLINIKKISLHRSWLSQKSPHTCPSSHVRCSDRDSVVHEAVSALSAGAASAAASAVSVDGYSGVLIQLRGTVARRCRWTCRWCRWCARRVWFVRGWRVHSPPFCAHSSSAGVLPSPIVFFLSLFIKAILWDLKVRLLDGDFGDNGCGFAVVFVRLVSLEHHWDLFELGKTTVGRSWPYRHGLMEWKVYKSDASLWYSHFGKLGLFAVVGRVLVALRLLLVR